jgi:aarF domain-containing kinase
MGSVDAGVTTGTAYEPPVPIELPAAGARRRAERSAVTLATFARHLGPVLAKRAAGRPVDGTEMGRRLRAAFEELGSTYLKFGQLVGSSPGAFGQAVADEFRGCLDTGPAVPFAVVREAVERTTGRPLDATFQRFETTALASASIAVVHRATLLDGREVAVKVLRPGIAQQCAIDLDVMEPLFKLLALRGVPVAGPLYRFLRGFRTQIAEELDLRNEARTMVHFAGLLDEGGLDRIVIPTPLPELSGPGVLVMGFLDGVAIDDLGAIEAMGHDPAPLVQELLRSWFLTGLRFGMFHGDIHAGNLMLLRDGRLGMIDWGIVGRLDGPTHRLFRRFVEAVLGDPTAWPEIAAFLSEMAPFRGDGDGPPREIPAEAKDEIEGLLTRPFGEVDLTGAFSGPGNGPIGGGRRARTPRTRAEKRARKARLRELRQRVIGSGFADSGFAQANFMLFKQLLYFERYGKLYLADSALLGDRDYLQHVLDTSPVPAG